METKKTHPISVCIITKNEETRIERCLASLKPYGFEIVVVDTGSTDRTREIAARYADKLLDFIWCDDFSAARNFSLEHASNDYVLILDCDETVLSLDATAVDALIGAHPDAVGLIARDNHYTSNGTDSVYQDRVERLFHRRQYHYESPIHEQVTNNRTGMAYESYDLPVTVDHSGYTGTQEELRAKVERNNALLLQELQKTPADPYLYFQIGQSYNMICDYENAYDYYRQALGFETDPREEWVQMLIIAYANALLHTGREAEALQLRAVYDDFAFTADFFCMMGRVYLANGQYLNAMMEFVKAIHCPVAREKGVNSFIPTYNMGLINEMMGDIPAALTHYRNCGDFPMALEKVAQLENSLSNPRS